MNLNIFSPVKRVRKREKDKDEFDRLIDVIETFAPKEHLDEREAFYYNYKIMAQYRTPLLGLLQTASQVGPLREDQETHAVEIFMRLKAFYDVRGKLTVQEAVKDTGLVRRFHHFFTLFYGRKDLSAGQIGEWLERL
ncbi:MAG: hypothetical protein JRJ09_08435 [Deltaproteobacteria bacterium]|nr:hypothetical protein [Deltaproteobacteria bacterium]MBW2048540.1 hypothetical protein [Deltaproteobacteria bacterium]MBW2110919.1 hypothetical protein [Deltaproteobacteria bacterium]MBW2353301.1 hypothetical protein [Deltaproteobacteria bacterium]HDZ91011.1 hypothetical protein [Deltaproteobacteria bacterium]